MNIWNNYSRVLISIFSLFFLVVFVSNSALAQDEVIEEKAETVYLSEVRPGPQDQELPVSVGIIVIDIDGIDGAQQSFIANFGIIVEWKDPRLAQDIDYMRVMDKGDVWTPSLQILNQQKLFETFPEQVQVLPDGTVTYVQRYWGTLSYPMNLENFPSDSHDLQIKLVAVGKDAHVLDFSINEEKSGLGEVLTVTDWNIVNWETFSEVVNIGPNLPDLQGVIFQFEAERLVGFYFIKVLVPLIMIVFISLIVLFIDPTHIGPKFSIAITAILTLIAYRFLLGNLLPKISYLTDMDYFLFGSMFLVFAVLVETSVVARYVGREREKEAKMLDYWSRWAFVILFIIILTGSFSF